METDHAKTNHEQQVKRQPKNQKPGPGVPPARSPTASYETGYTFQATGLLTHMARPGRENPDKQQATKCTCKTPENQDPSRDQPLAQRLVELPKEQTLQK